MITFLFVLLSASIYAQNLEHLKSQDTVYIILTETHNMYTEKLKDIYFYSTGNGSINEYTFKDSLNRSIVIRTQNDDKFPQRKINILCNRRKFLKENQNKIITMDFIQQHGVPKVFNDILRGSKKKIVYLIDKRSLKKRKILLKKAAIAAVGYEEL